MGELDQGGTIRHWRASGGDEFPQGPLKRAVGSEVISLILLYKEKKGEEAN